MHAILKRWPALRVLRVPPAISSPAEGDRYQELVERIRGAAPVGRAPWVDFASAVSTGQLTDAAISYILTEVMDSELCSEDIEHLANAMLYSGQIIDYRPCVRPRRLIRRYPSGAISEKVALILPSLIAAAADAWPVASNFLVARSLGFTGGTWDKLSAIPGFSFPEPGEATERLLRACQVAMCVTHHGVNPCDQKLYVIRSAIDAIESDALIVSSIASKQLAIPADCILLDMLHGDGAFLREEVRCRSVGNRIKEIVEGGGLRCFVELRGTELPSGVALGNAVEVAEAIATMRARGTEDFPPWALELQWRIVCRHFASLMNEELRVPHHKAIAYANEVRDSGVLLRSFFTMLVAHGVRPEDAGSLIGAPENFLWSHGTVTHDIASPKGGTIYAVDQRRIGGIVNFALGAGASEYAGSRSHLGGLILRCAKGSQIAVGQPLCSLILPQAGAEALIAALESALVASFEVVDAKQER